MQDNREALYRPATDDFTFLSGDIPDITALELWRVGAIRIYRPGNYPDMLMTIDIHGHQRTWPFVSASARTAALYDAPLWIDYGEVTYGLADYEIAAFDRWARNPEGTPSLHWEEYIRPMLVPTHPPDPFEHPVLQVSRRDLSAPSSPPSAPSLQVSQPDLSAPSSRLPIHIQRLVIDAAINTRATCPITMEPITADNAVITPCGHVFGTELTHRVSMCPVCRSCL